MALAIRQLCRLASRQVQRPRTLLSRVCGSQIGQDHCRYLSLHEYQSIQLLEDAGVLTPKGGVAETPQQAYEIGEVI
ncbi:succinate-- ligase [ADP-forming] subunit beta, mitochondrial-like, partial [Paramuricea clavata]